MAVHTVLVAGVQLAGNLQGRRSLTPFFSPTAASIIPIFKGAKTEAFGPFSPKAEMINGRAAMLGLAAMLVIEGVKGTALF